jgi:hypothetical protein
MGSSDSLPAGFKIRFESLNFQATGNGYLMRITNHAELHPWRSTGPGPVPATPATDAPAPPKQTLRALGATTPTTLWPALSSGADGTTSGSTRHLTTRRTR